MEKSIISLNALTGEEIRGLVKTAVDIKKNMTKFSTKLSGKTLFLLFQKTSTRTCTSPLPCSPPWFMK